MKIRKFYICDVALFLFSIGFIKLYDAFLYEYIDFWVESLAYILIVASIVIGVGASIAFIIQKLCKKKIDLYKSFKYTFIVIAILSGLAGAGFFAYAYFDLVSGWDALGCTIVGIFGLGISGISIAVLVIYYIARKVIANYEIVFDNENERSNEDDVKGDTE